MLYDDSKPQHRRGHAVEQLGENDAPAMMALAALTKPGPFVDRTHLLGEYWGIKQGGRLVAMAGERLKQPGFCEISGVCTHPDFQGRGFGRELCLLLLDRITSRGEQAYLPVNQSNMGALALYKAIDFRERRQINIGQLESV